MTLPCRIELFGGLRVIHGDRVISRFQTQKTGALLAYLAMHLDRPIAREVIAELLWPDGDPIAIRNRLNQAVSSLRRQLHPPGVAQGSILVADHHTVSLNAAIVTVDVIEFMDCVKSAKEETDEGQKLAHLIKAASLYKGDLLDGYYEEWAFGERLRLNDLYANILNGLVRLFAANGDIDNAIEAGSKLLLVDPTEEKYHNHLIRLYIAAGRPKAAIAQYEELVRSLATLDLTPTETAVTLRQEAEDLLGKGAEEEVVTISEQKGRLDAVSARFKTVQPGLPRFYTRFIGRDEELNSIDSQLNGQIRLLSLTGMGGSGKTRLAVEAAWKAAERFENRVGFVSLVDTVASDEVPDVIARELSVPSNSSSGIERLIDYLSDFPNYLLVLDNLEHLADQDLSCIARLLLAVPNLSILATSRQTLNIDGEHTLPLLPLAIPCMTPATTLEELSVNPSIELFVNRAQSVRQDFQLTDRTAEALVDLCRRLEGIPLAIELAAAWARSMTASQMLDQVSAHYDRLESRRKDINPRHRSVRAAIDGSYAMLEPELQSAFQRLSIFHGGWTHDAAAHVCPDSDIGAALQAIEEQSLIIADPTVEGMRFRMLETLQTYAQDQVSPSVKTETGWLHAEYFADLVTRARTMVGGTGIHLVEPDYANVATALSWYRKQNDIPNELKLAAEIGGFMLLTNRTKVGRDWLEVAMDRAKEVDIEPNVRAEGYMNLGKMAWVQGEYSIATGHLRHALELFESTGNVQGQIEVQVELQLEAHRQSNFAETRDILQGILKKVREVGDKDAEAVALRRLGNAHVELGDREAAKECYEASLKVGREMNSAEHIATAFGALGNLATLNQQNDAARVWLEESLAMFDRHGFTTYAIDATHMLVKLCRRTDKIAEGLMRLRTVLQASSEHYSLHWQTYLEYAYLFFHSGDYADAARVIGYTEACWESSGSHVFGIEERFHEEYVAELRQHLGAETYDELVEIGRHMSAEEAEQFVVCAGEKLLLEPV
ncbi:MAG: hypothetical protein KF784_14165 [Fimbriimonadaceae bacterium]|nr:hypothetical protein [Fimbriimonadaceae bacterium]